MTPSELLTKAADLVRDTAAAATPGPWSVTPNRYTVREVRGARRPVADYIDGKSSDAEWIALASPAVAPMVEWWLRFSAAQWEVSERQAGIFEVHRLDTGVGGLERQALKLAEQIAGERAVLGVGEEQQR